MKYFLLTIKHKWFVFLAGLKTKAPLWRLIIHDWTKFLPSELPHYQRQFFGKADQPENFIKCWIHHQNHNPHHWEYWIPRTGHNRCEPPYIDNEPVPMPEWATREMVADWLGAGRVYEKKWPNMNYWKWLIENKDKIRLHENSEFLINKTLSKLGCLTRLNKKIQENIQNVWVCGKCADYVGFLDEWVENSRGSVTKPCYFCKEVHYLGKINCIK